MPQPSPRTVGVDGGVQASPPAFGVSVPAAIQFHAQSPEHDGPERHEVVHYTHRALSAHGGSAK